MSTITTSTPIPLPVCTFRPARFGLERWLGSLEAPIMEIVWAATLPVSVHSALKQLRREHNSTIGYTTVMTTMTRLHTKGFLARKKSGLSFYYTARETRAAFEQRQIDLIMDSIGRAE